MALDLDQSKKPKGRTVQKNLKGGKDAANSPFTLELRTVQEPFQAQCKRMQNRSKPIRFAGIGSTYKCRSRPIRNSYFFIV